jgi:hypothetical protein
VAIDPSKIAKAIRAAQAAKKKVAKIPAGQASKVAREQVRGTGNKGRKINKRTGLTPEEASTVRIKQPVTKSNFGRARNPEDIKRGERLSEYERRMKLSNPPKPKTTKPAKKEVFLTRGKNIAKRSEVEEVTAKRLEKQARRERTEKIFKAMTPQQKRTLMARAQVKRAQREENAGITKYGMDVKPRQQLDEKVIERAKELTAQEKNNIARKEAIEFGQRRESDRRATEGLKARNKNIADKMKNMTPDQKRRFVNYLRESGW